MRKETVKHVIAGLLLVLASTLVLTSQPSITTASLASGPGGEAVLALERAEQGGGAQVEKNPFVVALEKKIAGQETRPAEEVFKSIQMLKGMPAGRILRIMQTAFNTSLGVDCTHCHVADQWEKNDKEAKQTARKMWALVAKVNSELQQAIGKGTVNCTTCHRGQVKPATNMPGPK